MDLIEEDVDEVVLNLQLVELGGVVNAVLGARSCIGLLNECLNPLMEHIRDRLHLGFLIGAHGGESIRVVASEAYLASGRRLAAQVLG